MHRSKFNHFLAVGSAATLLLYAGTDAHAVQYTVDITPDSSTHISGNILENTPISTGLANFSPTVDYVIDGKYVNYIIPDGFLGGEVVFLFNFESENLTGWTGDPSGYLSDENGSMIAGTDFAATPSFNGSQVLAVIHVGPNTDVTFYDMHLTLPTLEFYTDNGSDPPTVGGSILPTSLEIQYSGQAEGELLVGAVESPTDVPEPAALAILGLGLAGLGLMRRKRAA